MVNFKKFRLFSSTIVKRKIDKKRNDLNSFINFMIALLVRCLDEISTFKRRNF